MVTVFQSLASAGAANAESAIAPERRTALNFIDEVSSEVDIGLAAAWGRSSPACPFLSDF
jgi:hypothetical protein